MKKVIERMDRAVRIAQQQQQQHATSEIDNAGAVTKDKEKEKEKSGRRWGLPSLGGGRGNSESSSKSKDKDHKDAGEDAAGGSLDALEGLRVDQYLVVFLKFMSSIGEHEAVC